MALAEKLLAEEFNRPGHAIVDHRTYDHTSIMRFLQWRFLGAPAEGPGDDGSPWALKVRDRFANNIGNSLAFEQPDPTIFDIGDLPPVADSARRARAASRRSSTCRSTAFPRSPPPRG